jgi:hypothetical protein
MLMFAYCQLHLYGLVPILTAQDCMVLQKLIALAA